MRAERYRSEEYIDQLQDFAVAARTRLSWYLRRHPRLCQSQSMAWTLVKPYTFPSQGVGIPKGWRYQSETLTAIQGCNSGALDVDQSPGNCHQWCWGPCLVERPLWRERSRSTETGHGQYWLQVSSAIVQIYVVTHQNWRVFLVRAAIHQHG